MSKKLLSVLMLGGLVVGLGYGLVGFSATGVDATSPFSIENENSNGNSNENSNKPNTNTDPGRVACILAAITPRETAIVASWDKYSASMKTAYDKRATDLTAAWSITDKKLRQAAVKKAWKDFKLARKTARKTFNNERSNTWKTFEQARKACRVNSDGFGGSVDSQPGHQD